MFKIFAELTAFMEEVRTYLASHTKEMADLKALVLDAAQGNALAGVQDAVKAASDANKTDVKPNA